MSKCMWASSTPFLSMRKIMSAPALVNANAFWSASIVIALAKR